MDDDMARKQPKVWGPITPRPVPADPAEKQTIIATCEAFIADVLKPRFLPVITPTPFNYPIDIHGDWRAGRYRFITRYRSGQEATAGQEFDAPFMRLDHMGPDRFDLYWMRHTGQWWPLHSGLSQAASLKAMIDSEVLYPL